MKEKKYLFCRLNPNKPGERGFSGVDVSPKTVLNVFYYWYFNEYIAAMPVLKEFWPVMELYDTDEIKYSLSTVSSGKCFYFIQPGVTEVCLR